VGVNKVAKPWNIEERTTPLDLAANAGLSKAVTSVKTGEPGEKSVTA
jgi:hypothetical protein